MERFNIAEKHGNTEKHSNTGKPNNTENNSKFEKHNSTTILREIEQQVVETTKYS